jgi:hypothetical protein
MVIHIGYRKTGTTFLQHHVFPYLNGLKYYDYTFCKDLFMPLLQTSTLDFDKSLFTKKIDNHPQSLYSYEALVGDMGTGLHNYEIALKLKEIGFKKVIITIRNQKSIVDSIYKQYIHEGGVLKPKDYFGNKRFFNWESCDYYNLIKHYSNVFGIENIYVMLQEDLLKDREKVVNNIISFTGASSYELPDGLKMMSNKSLSYFSVKILRILNHFTYNHYRPSNLISKKISTNKMRGTMQKLLDPLFPSKLLIGKTVVPSEIIEKASTIYIENNKKLEKEFNLDLKKYNYY